MSSSSKWSAFWLIVIGVVIGIILTATTVGTVQVVGSETFCGGFCHTMDAVTYSWKQGQHARTPVGFSAGCSDCHLLNETNHPLKPHDYLSLLLHKGQAASISGFGQIMGTISTPQKWVKERPELSKRVIEWMTGNNFHNCRGCHNLADMYNPKKPMVAKMHAAFIDKPANCVMCHKNAGHNYKGADEWIEKNGTWPNPADAWVQADATTEKK